MTAKKVLFSIAIACSILIGCKKNKEAKKEVKIEKVALAISGMTCEIGCAKIIQSKLSKKEGVIDAKVIFTDSIATIEFDTNTTSKKELITYINGIAGGNLYKASESTSYKTATTHLCSDSCKKECEDKTTIAACKETCKMACCADKTKTE